MPAAQIEFATATDGTATVIVNGTAIHSRYHPIREAQRLVAGQLRESVPETVILFEPGLGYAAAAIRQSLPNARILAITFESAIAERAMPLLRECGAEVWSSDGVSLDRFLERHIDDLHLASLAVVDPSVAARCFPEAHRERSEVLRDVLARQKASVATTAGFGRRWLRNAVDNTLRIERVTPLPTVQRPLVVAASGPSLEEVARPLAGLRRHFELWALPSALRALAAAGLEPDLVVATDPGYYATAHFFRQRVARVAMPLSAAPLPSRAQPAVSLFAEGHGFEHDLLAVLGIDLPVVTPAGTVATTAIKLAERCGARWILLAGLDLCYRDLLAHARPSLSAELLEERARRTRPYPTQLLAHAMDHAPERVAVGGSVIRRGPALDAYASWFDRVAKSAATVARLLPSPISTGGLRELEPAALEGALHAAVSAADRVAAPKRDIQRGRAPTWPSQHARVAAVGGLLADWARQIAAAGRVPTAPDQLRGTAVWHLAHYCETAELLRSRTALRRGEEWVRTWRKALQGCQRLVDNIDARVRAA